MFYYNSKLIISEYNDIMAFHPGYYIKEIIDDSGLTQADFAKRLGTTPKNISILVRGEQSLSRIGHGRFLLLQQG